MRRRCFSGVPNRDGVVGVEVLTPDRDEADVRRLPDAGDQRIAAIRELSAGLLDRQCGEFGAVICKENRPGGRHVLPPLTWSFRSRTSRCAAGHGAWQTAAANTTPTQRRRGSDRG